MHHLSTTVHHNYFITSTSTTCNTPTTYLNLYFYSHFFCIFPLRRRMTQWFPRSNQLSYVHTAVLIFTCWVPIPPCLPVLCLLIMTGTCTCVLRSTDEQWQVAFTRTREYDCTISLEPSDIQWSQTTADSCLCEVFVGRLFGESDLFVFSVFNCLWPLIDTIHLRWRIQIPKLSIILLLKAFIFIPVVSSDRYQNEVNNESIISSFSNVSFGNVARICAFHY